MITANNDANPPKLAPICQKSCAPHPVRNTARGWTFLAGKLCLKQARAPDLHHLGLASGPVRVDAKDPI